MVFETIQGTLRQTNLPNESEEYLKKREELRVAELELMRQRERVAAMRRELPPGATIQDYEFQEGPRDLNAGDTPVRTVRLSELFSAPGRTLVVYHFMYGKKQASACPACTLLLDGLNGIAHQLDQNIDYVVVAAAEPAALRAYARKRGWDKTRLVSAGTSTFKFDLGSESPEGRQDSTISVFTRDADGTIRHFYTGHPWMATDVKERGLDLITPAWTMLDLTPQGRGEWRPKLEYPTKSQASGA